jgi:hypothetical protein
MQTALQCLVIDAQLLRPLHHGLGFVLEGDKVIAAAIPALLLHCRPAAILFGVALIIVFALYGHRRRALSHIRQKLTEVLPCLADSNTSTCPVGILWLAGIRAAFHHACPGVIGATTFTRKIMPVFRLRGTNALTHVAATRGRIPTYQVATRRYGFASTTAVAVP